MQSSGKLSDIGIIEVEAAVAAALSAARCVPLKEPQTLHASHRRSGYSYELMRIGIRT